MVFCLRNIIIKRKRERKGGEVFILCIDNNIEFICYFNEF